MTQHTQEPNLAYSRALRTGQQPELPGLRGNKFWQRSVAPHNPFSVASSAQPRVYDREEDLGAMARDLAQEDEKWARQGIIFRHEKWDQSNADRERGNRGIGTSSKDYAWIWSKARLHRNMKII